MNSNKSGITFYCTYNINCHEFVDTTGTLINFQLITIVVILQYSVFPNGRTPHFLKYTVIVKRITPIL